MWKGDHLCTLKKAIASACEKVIASVDPGGLMIDTERINSQLSHGKFKRFNLFLLHVGIKTVYITVYNWHREDQQSLHVKRWIASACMMRRKGDCLCDPERWCACGKGITSAHEKVIHICWSWEDWWNDAERINSQLSHENSKDLTYFSCMLVLKLFTLLFTIDTERINSLCMSKGDFLHEKVITSAKGDCLLFDPGGDWWSMQRGTYSQLSHGKFKRFNLFFCMLVLKLFTLLFTINARINSLCMWKGNCLCMWKGDHLCTWKGDHLCWSWGLGDWQWITQRGSTVNFHMENSKDLTWFLLHVGIKTVYITVYNDTVSAWKGDCLCMWKGNCWSAHEKAIYVKRWLHMETVNFHMGNSKD